jgi:hypothetical protein
VTAERCATCALFTKCWAALEKGQAAGARVIIFRKFTNHLFLGVCMVSDANRLFVPENPLVLSYLGLRKAVGIIGFFLPFVLAVGKMILQGPGIESSISDYYYTDMRNVFVGSMCAIGVFLLSCRGYDSRDERAGRFSCVCAIGVALFPTTPSNVPSFIDKFIGGLHLVFATLLFLTFAYFCIRLFTATDPHKKPTRRKLLRNKVYFTCGYTILGCIALLGIVNLPFVKPLIAPLTPVFWLEAIAVVAFGTAWLIKGETILKDQAQADAP